MDDICIMPNVFAPEGDGSKYLSLHTLCSDLTIVLSHCGIFRANNLAYLEVITLLGEKEQ